MPIRATTTLFHVIKSMRLFESDKQITSLMPNEAASERPASNTNASAARAEAM